MNAQERYERRLDRAVAEPAPSPEMGGSVDPLAVHRDPSTPPQQATQESEQARPGIAWVRPSEVPTALGLRYVRRGIDLEADLARRVRRAPGAAVSTASRRISRASIARPATTDPMPLGQEGLGL